MDEREHTYALASTLRHLLASEDEETGIISAGMRRTMEAEIVRLDALLNPPPSS